MNRSQFVVFRSLSSQLEMCDVSRFGTDGGWLPAFWSSWHELVL